MSITSIKVSNFKNFKNCEVDLRTFNVLLGANASGKTNFISIFRFLRDIACHGIENAISIQGGIDYLRNINLKETDELSIRIACAPNFTYISPKRFKGRKLQAKVIETAYEFTLRFHRFGSGFSILKDELKRKIEFVFIDRKTDNRESQGIGTANVIKRKRHIIPEFSLPDSLISLRLSNEDAFFNFGYSRFAYPTKELIINLPVASVFPYQVPFEDISIYDIDPKLSKKAVPITSKIWLEEDGNNLAIILNNLFREKKRTIQFNDLLKDYLPFIERANINRLADKSMIFSIKETYFTKNLLPASFVSDGTINIIALICALYFEKTSRSEPLSLKIIEEPERNMHPHLISKIASMMKDVSKKTQIIATTHNPEFIKHAGVENVILISRDADGFSTIFRPSDSEAIKVFLKNEIGIEELFVQNLLNN